MQHAMPKLSGDTSVHKPLKIHLETLTSSMNEERAYRTLPMPLRNNSAPHTAKKSAAFPPQLSLGYYKCSEVLVSESLVSKALKQLKSSFSCSPDGIPSAVLKAFGEILVPILTCIFQTSLKTGKFPSRWKNARVVPVIKSGSKLDPTNYRPISILCAASKLFESILHKLLTFSIKTILIPEQHGFFSGRSTTTNLVNFMLRASEAVQGRGQLDVVYFDLSKAFDVSHELLFKKLSQLDIQPSFISLICNYL